MVDLKIAKKLKINGFPQKGCSYIYGKQKLDKKYFWTLISEGEDEQRPITYEEVNAPNSDEILDELPKEIDNFNLDISCFNDGYTATYITYDWDDIIGLFDGIETNLKFDKNLANVLANLWLYLKKERYLD